MQTEVQNRLEQLQALGFASELDYREHWRVLNASKQLAAKQRQDSIAAGSTAFDADAMP